MLLNLSNHPSSLWTDNQKKKALELYSVIEDLPFPQISPSLDTTELDLLVENYENKIRKINPLVVHIMGEMTFTFRLINRLQAVGITCVASTTIRNVIEKNGTKTSVFEFVQFRDY